MDSIMPLSLSDRLTPRESWLLDLIQSQSITTPALVLESLEVKRILDLFSTHLPEAKIFYAVKANNDSSLLQFLASHGTSFDVASDQELLQLRSLGVPPSRMILSNPVKSAATINTFFDQGLSLTSVDSPYDLQELKNASTRIHRKEEVNVFARIRISVTDVQIDLNNKFGCSEAEAITLLRDAKAAGFRPRGVHFHVGTQSWNVQNFRIGIESALRIIDALNSEYGIKCDSVNIGGGYPDPVVAREAGGIESFFANLSQVVKPIIERGLNLLVEPGRVVVSSAGSAVCTVIGKSVRNGTSWLYLDDGAYGLYSGKFFDHKDYSFRVLRQAESSNGSFVPYVIAGPSCDSIDIVTQPTMLPANLNIGDILCTHNMGAYSTTTGCHFNGFGYINSYLIEQRETRSSVASSGKSRTIGNRPLKKAFSI